MRLSIQKSKNHVFLYIVKDFYSKGKRTTKIIDKLGTVSSLMLHLNLSYDEVILWARQKAKDLTLNDSHVSNKIILSFSANSLLPINDIRAFNCGYLFLQSLLYQMKIANIFRNISSKQKCLFHLESIFTDLVYSRILHPSSKRSSFAFSYSFLEPPKYQLEDVYRSLSIFSKMSDYILSELYKNSNFLLFIMTVRTIILKLNKKMASKNMVKGKNIDPTLSLAWVCLWMGMAFLFLTVCFPAIKMNRLLLNH